MLRNNILQWLSWESSLTTSVWNLMLTLSNAPSKVTSYTTQITLACREGEEEGGRGEGGRKRGREGGREREREGGRE